MKHVLLHPRIHHNARCNPNINGTCRSKLLYCNHCFTCVHHLITQSWPFTTKHQDGFSRQSRLSKRHTAWQVINCNNMSVTYSFHKFSHCLVVKDVQIPVCYHSTPLVPVTLANNMNSSHIKRVGVSHNRANIHIMLPIFDGHMQINT